MAVISLATPTARRSAPTTDYAALERALKSVVRGDVRFDAGARAAYSTDASNYRQVPIAVVCPVDVDDAVAAVRVCHEHDVPVLNRGGGTSLGGECCNVAVVLDWTKHVHGVESVDRAAKKAVILPGTPLDDANQALAEHDLVIGPRPATHSHCTIGGMVGNNSCGATAQWSGTMARNVSRLEILTYDGLRMWVGPTSADEFASILAAGGRKAEIYRSLRDLRDRYANQIATRFPDIPRRISGFNLPALSDMNVARALVGSESTCVTVLRVEMNLLRPPKRRATVVLGYPDIAAAGDAVPGIATHQPIQLEGVDEKLFRYERDEHRPTEVLKFLPEGRAWLVVQLGADTEEEVRAKATELAGEHGVILEGEQEERLSSVREAGLATTARTPNGPDAWPGWEDSAVDPARLGDYLRAFQDLLDEYGYGATSIYGH